MMARRRRNDTLVPSDRNLDLAQELLAAFVRGLLPRSHAQWPIALVFAFPDGHVRGDGIDFGDGPILWAAVRLWHAIEGRDRSKPPR